MKANKNDKNKSKWHSQASHLHHHRSIPQTMTQKRCVPLQFSLTRINLEYILGKKRGVKKKEKKREEEKKRRKIRTRAFWIEDIYFPRGDANKNGIGVFRLIDKTVAAGCNSFPYHWPSSRSGYRGRCTLRARSSFHRLRSSRIEH